MRLLAPISGVDPGRADVMVRVLSTVPAQVRAGVLDVGPRSIRMSVPFFIAPKSRISMRFSARCREEGEITSCDPGTGSYCLTVAFCKEISRASRLPIQPGEIAAVAPLNPHSGECVTARMVAHVPGDDMVVNSPRPIAPETWLRLEIQSGIILGQVKCCTAIGELFRIAVVVEKVVPRSDPFRFMRYMLTDLRGEWARVSSSALLLPTLFRRGRPSLGARAGH